MTRVVFYSLYLQGKSEDTFRLAQLLFSLRSLRRHNPRIPVFLNLTGEIDRLFLHFLVSELGVIPVMFGSYEGLLDSVLPGSGHYLKGYPILHKFLTLLHFNHVQPAQVLYSDTDTLFFDDPEKLFAACSEHDIYGRLEFNTSPAELAKNPGYFQPEVYVELARSLGSRIIAPFNTGVMVLNNRIWERFWAEAKTFVEYVLRFTPPEEAGGQIPDFPPLPYPTINRWIRDQVAFWLIMGRLERFSFFPLTPAQVLMGAEEINAPGCYPRPVLSHYFTQNTEKYFQGLVQNPFKD